MQGENGDTSPAPSSWGGGARWGTERNNYRLVITSSLNGFSLISDGFTSNLKVITCNLNGFLLWGDAAAPGEPAERSFSIVCQSNEKLTRAPPCQNNRAFSSSQEGARAHTTASSLLDDQHNLRQTQVAAPWGRTVSVLPFWEQNQYTNLGISGLLHSRISQI